MSPASESLVVSDPEFRFFFYLRLSVLGNFSRGTDSFKELARETRRETPGATKVHARSISYILYNLIIDDFAIKIAGSGINMLN